MESCEKSVSEGIQKEDVTLEPIGQPIVEKNDDVAEKLQYDLYYLKNRNVLWEICILVKAVFLALGGRHE